MSQNNFILNSLLTLLNEDNLILPINIENSTIFNTIQNMIDDLENTINVSNISNENNNFVEFHIEFEFIENNNDTNNNLDIKYFKNCNEINNKLCKSTKIKKDDTILNENCLICMENYNCSELKRELPFCKHYFHKKCIDKWLKQKASCPICRDELIK